MIWVQLFPICQIAPRHLGARNMAVATTMGLVKVGKIVGLVGIIPIALYVLATLSGLAAMPAKLDQHMQQQEQILKVLKAQLCVSVTPVNEQYVKCALTDLLKAP